VTERSHIPALLAANTRARITAAVDRNLARAELVAGLCGAKAFSEVGDALPYFDAAIVALPHFLHAPESVPLLEAGKHVLVEKPMALTGQECDAMIRAAKQTGAVLCVGHMRRFCPAVAAAKRILSGGGIGKIVRWSILEGRIYDWPVTSDFFFRRETAGGGVLMDTGAHVLDMLVWFFGPVKEFTYFDDSFGGVEADCEMHMTMTDGGKGYVELSRTRNLPGILEVEGTDGQLLLDFSSNRCVLNLSPFLGKAPLTITSDYSAAGENLAAAMFSFQLADWLSAIEECRDPIVTAEEARKVVDLMESCYARRKPLQKPWISIKTEGTP